MYKSFIDGDVIGKMYIVDKVYAFVLFVNLFISLMQKVLFIISCNYLKFED